MISIFRALRETNEVTLLTREYNEHNKELSSNLDEARIIRLRKILPRVNSRLPAGRYLTKLRNALDALLSFPKEMDADIFIVADMYFLARWAKKRYRVPTIAIIFRPYFHTDMLQPTGLRPFKAFARCLEKRLYRSADLVLTNCIYIKDVIQSNLSINAEVLMSPIDPALFTPNYDIKRDNLILSVGRIDPCKHPLEMTKIFRQIEGDYELIIAGIVEPENEQYYQEVSKIAKTDNRITLIPNPPREHLPSLYQKASVFWHINPTEEVGGAILEAAACGTPTVAMRGGGLEQTIINSETGFVVENEDEFIHKTIFLLENKDARETMGKQAIEHAVKHHGIDVFSKKLNDFVDSLRYKVE